MKKSPVGIREYPKYVNNLREKYAIRIEIKKPELNTEEAHAAEHNNITKYLKTRLRRHEWVIQHNTGYKGLFYIWFKNKEDALAVTLSYGGTVV